MTLRGVTSSFQVPREIGDRASAQLVSAVVTRAHRADPKHMFGGWGPHLGHLFRTRAGADWFVDDLGADVNANAGLAYYQRDRQRNVWELRTIGDWRLSGLGNVQQNFASVMDAEDVIHSYGIDVSSTPQRLIACRYSTRSGDWGCGTVGSFALTPGANYVGAAITPAGTKIVWWTDVVQSNGRFHYVYHGGAGWMRGPESDCTPHNDASYVNIAFVDDVRFLMLALLPGGSAPCWSYRIGIADVRLGDPVVWRTDLDGGTGPDALFGTNDIWIDPRTKNVHALIRACPDNPRTRYFFAAGSSPRLRPYGELPGVRYARFVSAGGSEGGSSDRTGGGLNLIYGAPGEGLKLKVAPQTAVNGPIDWSRLATISLPFAGYETIQAIYPESRIYQAAPVRSLNFAVNGSCRQQEILHISHEQAPLAI